MPMEFLVLTRPAKGLGGRIGSPSLRAEVAYVRRVHLAAKAKEQSEVIRSLGRWIAIGRCESVA